MKINFNFKLTLHLNIIIYINQILMVKYKNYKKPIYKDIDLILIIIK